MRVRDEAKYEAILKASQKLINEYGLSQTSMSKIAKEAGVSAATIYIYFENKDALLEELYKNIKKKAGLEMTRHIDVNAPVKQGMKEFFFAVYRYYLKNFQDLLLMEQFDNSPVSGKFHKNNQHHENFEKIVTVFEKGIKEGVLKDLPDELVAAFIFYPILKMVKSTVMGNLEESDEILELAFEMSWNSIRS